MITWAWVIADISLLGPLISLTIDTRLFCQSVWRSKLLLLLVSVYIALAYTTVASSAFTWLNIVHLSDAFPQSFRWESVGLIIAGTLVYAFVVNGSRRMLSRLDKHKVRPLSSLN